MIAETILGAELPRIWGSGVAPFRWTPGDLGIKPRLRSDFRS
jgi:hypothetical protein